MLGADGLAKVIAHQVDPPTMVRPVRIPGDPATTAPTRAATMTVIAA
jgi:hypothetical protein